MDTRPTPTIHNFMNLNKLLKTLKSQKTSKNEPLQQCQPIHTSLQSYQIPLQFMETEAQRFHVDSISKIRYFVLPNLPELANRVRGCPISVFNLLPYSGRKVKEINLHHEPYPWYLDFLKPLLDKQIPTYNHMLINDYPQKVGIMPHQDGPMYNPKVFVLSLNSYAIINFQKTIEDHSYQSRILLEPNSIHIFQEQAYTSCLHGIQNYLYDSVLLFYSQEERKVKRSSIANFEQLKCRQEIINRIENWKQEEENGQIDIVKVEDNEEFNWKVEFRRKERISITIRQKYQ